MDVRTLVENYISQTSYDGLCSDDMECGCMPPDLFPCDGPFDTCLLGHKIEDPTGEYDFRIKPPHPDGR